MKYFEVKLETLRGSLVDCGEVYADGELVSESGADEIEIRELITGYNVWEYEEDGTTIGVEHYPVTTDMTSWEDNSEEVLAKIRNEHLPEDGWQNNNW